MYKLYNKKEDCQGNEWFVLAANGLSSPAAGSWFSDCGSQAIRLNRQSGGAVVSLQENRSELHFQADLRDDLFRPLNHT